jgi:hypothetical protein
MSTLSDYLRPLARRVMPTALQDPFIFIYEHHCVWIKLGLTLSDNYIELPLSTNTNARVISGLGNADAFYDLYVLDLCIVPRIFLFV